MSPQCWSRFNAQPLAVSISWQLSAQCTTGGGPEGQKARGQPQHVALPDAAQRQWRRWRGREICPCGKFQVGAAADWKPGPCGAFSPTSEWSERQKTLRSYRVCRVCCSSSVQATYREGSSHTPRSLFNSPIPPKKHERKKKITVSIVSSCVNDIAMSMSEEPRNLNRHVEHILGANKTYEELHLSAGLFIPAFLCSVYSRSRFYG